MRFRISRVRGHWECAILHGKGMGCKIHSILSLSLWMALRVFYPKNLKHAYKLIKAREEEQK